MIIVSNIITATMATLVGWYILFWKTIVVTDMMITLEHADTPFQSSQQENPVLWLAHVEEDRPLWPLLFLKAQRVH